MSNMLYGMFSIPLTDSESEDLDLDLPAMDIQRDMTMALASDQGVEILEGPPQVITGTVWMLEPAQVWKYPARRRA